MVPDAQPLHDPGPPVRPPPIPNHSSYHGHGPPPVTPSWAQPQHNTMNAFPQGYPASTPYAQYMNMGPPQGAPGSYYNPPVVLPGGVPPTPQQQIGPDGFSTDWIGPQPAAGGSGWNPGVQHTPFNGPQPHTGFNSFQQALPGGPPPGFGGPPQGFGGPPQGFGGPPQGFAQQWGQPPPVPYGGPGTPAAWHQAVPPAAAQGWGPPPQAPGAWTQQPAWGGGLPAGSQSPAGWAGGGGGHWQQPVPPVVPQPPPAPSAAHAHRDRSNEGLDTVDKFAGGPNCMYKS